MKRVLLSWSSGKDSAWTLHVLRRDPTIELCGLVTTLNAEFDRVAMMTIDAWFYARLIKAKLGVGGHLK